MGARRLRPGRRPLRPPPVRALLVLALAGLVLGVLGCGEPSEPEARASADRSPAPTAPARPSTTAPSTSAPPPTTTTPAATTAPNTSAPVGDLAGRVVVIDPGHNGANGSHPEEINRPVDAGGFSKACNTTGTAAPDLTESALNLDLARRLEEVLRARGASVVLTRTDDEGWGPCIDERGRSAAEHGADLLLSIHADGAEPGAHGFHVISAPRSGPGSDGLAAAVRDGLVAAGFTPATYVGEQGLVVRDDLGTLNWATSPAAMVECGNMHDERDLATFRDPAGRQRIALALAEGIARFLAGSPSARGSGAGEGPG